ncbi:Hypothetical predicted protein [Mytilus galloprovincialis]|uniref:Uncharacterized protein n=1 Tax=Mytilus galloprovincialis TaxID=29158 RepID=A0A8B6DVA9_MYTGA|nr:Hypothetical predicted protein [Mytilus galloprovincialis]
MNHLQLNELQDAIADTSDTSDTSPGKDKVTYNDSAIWLCGKNIGYIQRRIQKDLDNIKSWCDKWGFLISPSKTVAIVFSRKKKTEKLVLTLGNSLLQVVNEVKFLGIIIDSKLTWLKHIQYIEAKCSKVLNCMKLLTGTKWGANSHSLRNIYIALIRSKIDYGCEVYNSASHSVKKILDRVQSQALRICTGAYKNVATSGLQVEMGDPPYEERRQCLITKSFLNISSHEDNHPTKESLAKKATFLCYSREIKQNKKPYFIVSKDMINQHDVDINQIYKYKQFPTPPWHLTKPRVCTQLSNLISKKDNPHLIRSESNFMIDTQYRQFLKIYTDGSKDPNSNKTSCAFAIPEMGIKKGFKLPKNMSIFTCELMAIFLSLIWLEEFKPNNVIVFVDSLSALQALKSNLFKVKNYLLYDIIFLYNQLVKLDTIIPNISLALYNYLCHNIVGTEEHVKTIRLMSTIRDNFSSSKSFTFITSGSYGEGLEMRGSDLDIMQVVKSIKVNADEHDFDPSITYLSTDTDDVKPGFTQLRLEYSRDQYDLECCEEHNDHIRFYVDSTLTPDELLMEGWNKPYYFPSTAYAYFLSVLCHYHLNNVRHCQDSIQGLKLVIGEKYLMSDVRSTADAYTLLGIVLQLFGDTESARQAFLQSLKIYPDESYNSAARRLV